MVEQRRHPAEQEVQANMKHDDPLARQSKTHRGGIHQFLADRIGDEPIWELLVQAGSETRETVFDELATENDTAVCRHKFRKRGVDVASERACGTRGVVAIGLEGSTHAITSLGSRLPIFMWSDRSVTWASWNEGFPALAIWSAPSMDPLIFNPNAAARGTRGVACLSEI